MTPPAQQSEQNMKTNVRGRQNNAGRDRGGQSSIILSGYDSVIAGLRSLRSLRLILSPLSGPVRIPRIPCIPRLSLASVASGCARLGSRRLTASRISGPVRMFRVFRGCSPSLLRQANWEVKVPKLGTLTSHHKGDN
jgi:hypothetical protein